MSNKQEVEQRLQRKVGQGVAGGVMQSVFDDNYSTHIMNRWMIGTHIQWGLSLAVTFVGLNYFMIWLTETFVIPPWAVALVLTPIGAGYTLFQVLKYRKPPTPRAS